MRLTSLEVVDFRSYASAQVSFEPGVSTLLGRNGQGKTNLIEAAGYVATLGSHRVASDAPLVKHGSSTAIIRAGIHRDGRDALRSEERRVGKECLL